MLVPTAGWLIWQWRELARRPNWLVSAAVLTTLICSPYLLNYDYVLLLVPFILVAEAAAPFEWVGLAIAYLLPLASLVEGFGTRGNFTLVFAGVVLIVLLTVCLRRTAKDQQGLGDVIADDAH